MLTALARVVSERRQASPQTSYVAKLHADGLDQILKKVGEEATETVIAAKNGERGPIISETADLWFHVMVMLDKLDISHDEVLGELERRLGISGIAEKAARER